MSAWVSSRIWSTFTTSNGSGIATVMHGPILLIGQTMNFRASSSGNHSFASGSGLTRDTSMGGSPMSRAMRPRRSFGLARPCLIRISVIARFSCSASAEAASNAASSTAPTFSRIWRSLRWNVDIRSGAPQQLLELAGLGRVGDGLLVGDLVRAVEVGERLVHRPHALLPRRLHDAVDLVRLVLADQRAHGRRREQDLAREHAAAAVAERQELLAEHAG